MESGFLRAVCAGALLVAGPLHVRGQSASVPSDVKAFAAQYVAAFNSGDKARLESLHLPESRACITPANREVYDELLTMQMRDSVPPGYLLSLVPMSEGDRWAVASEATFPVKPERELHIDYQYPNTNDGGQLVVWLVRRDGRWMADFPCMTAQGIQHYRDNAAAREHYRTMAAAIQEPLRSELLAMLRVHKMGEAETRYHEATGADMRTAMLVINALGDQAH
jgi:hypothetical protein